MAVILNDDFSIRIIIMSMLWWLGLWLTPKASRWSKGAIAGTLLLVGGVLIYGLINWTTLFWNEYKVTDFPESISYPQGWNVRVLGDSEVAIWQETATVSIKKFSNQVLDQTSQELVLTELIQEIPNIDIFEDSISGIDTTTYANCLAMTRGFDAGPRTSIIRGKAYAVQCDSSLYTLWAVGDRRNIDVDVAVWIAETNIANLR